MRVTRGCLEIETDALENMGGSSLRQTLTS